MSEFRTLLHSVFSLIWYRDVQYLVIKAHLLKAGNLEIGQMRITDFFAWRQIDENNPASQSSQDGVRVIVLKVRRKTRMVKIEVVRYIRCLRSEFFCSDFGHFVVMSEIRTFLFVWLQTHFGKKCVRKLNILFGYNVKNRKCLKNKLFSVWNPYYVVCISDTYCRCN